MSASEVTKQKIVIVFTHGTFDENCKILIYDWTLHKHVLEITLHVTRVIPVRCLSTWHVIANSIETLHIWHQIVIEFPRWRSALHYDPFDRRFTEPASPRTFPIYGKVQNFLSQWTDWICGTESTLSRDVRPSLQSIEGGSISKLVEDCNGSLHSAFEHRCLWCSIMDVCLTSFDSTSPSGSLASFGEIAPWLPMNLRDP